MPVLSVVLSSGEIAILDNIAKIEEERRKRMGSGGRVITAAAIAARLIRERLKEMEDMEVKAS
ncbi:hypothetical protein DRN97_02165 [Methanosarcinales archaeon]|nr:MAG: hypothetical protein DRN97_02165 [Methanosarcinales archaeon]